MMSPHRTRGTTGHFRFDRVFPKPVGRLNVSAWTENAKLFRAYNAMLDALWEHGHEEALVRLTLPASDPRRLKAPQLYAAMKAGRLGNPALLTDLELAAPLWATAERVVAAMPCTYSTQRRYIVSFRQLARTLANLRITATTIGGLATIPWAQVFGAMLVGQEGRGQGVRPASVASRNRVRAAVAHVLTAYLGDDLYHPFRRRVVKAMGKHVREEPRVVDLTVPDFWRLMDHVPEPLVACYVVMAITGLRVGEYLRATAVDEAVCAIRFTGGKYGGGSVYFDPEYLDYVRVAVPCNIGPDSSLSRKGWRGVEYDARYKRLWKALKAAGLATGIRWSWNHDLRHLFVQLGTDAVGQRKTQTAARHQSAAMTRLYGDRTDKGEVALAVGAGLRRKGGAR